MNATDPKTLKTENVRWDLSVFYTGIDDTQIDADIAELKEKTKGLHDTYKGKLDTLLGEAISAYSDIEMLIHKILYVRLAYTLDTGNTQVKAKLAKVKEALSAVSGEYLTFLELEVAALSDKKLEKTMNDLIVAKHKSWLKDIRIQKPFMLSEAVEGALMKRAPFGAGAWHQFFEEFSADLEFDWQGEKKTLEQMLRIFNFSKDAEERAQAQVMVNTGMPRSYLKYSAETLYMIAGATAVERRERGYAHPMQGRNLSNQTTDAVVDALHAAVTTKAAPLARRHYRLKAARLGMKKLRWSDRNAPMPFEDTSSVPFDEAISIVTKAYESFSPTLGQLIREMVQKKWIDALMVKGKTAGAFNATRILPGGKPTSWTLLNYSGSSRDVMTCAHELGHGVHGLLAGATQGVLMGDAPIAYAETASVFGEMITFELLKKQLTVRGDKEALFALLMGKIDDIINTIVRQIGFSNFERRLHGMDASYSMWSEPKKHSVEELDALWKATIVELYGEDGDVLTYENIEHLWAYIPHFHSPFYVYGYAFGELFVQSLYAKRKEFGDRFEPLYLDLLRSGSTKDAVELMKPFGLDPTSETFWEDGIKAGLGKLVEEAEALSKEMGIVV